MKRFPLWAAAWLLAAALCASGALAEEQTPPAVSAKSAFLLDCTAGRVLYEKNPDEQALIASTTKIMTALVAAETCDLDSSVVVPEEAVGIEGSSMYLRVGEVLTARDLLYGMLLHSGNDAAVALAICTAGDVQSFVEQMNEKARDLGLCHTSFANPNGLDDAANHSTARELAYLAAAALENEVVAQAVAAKSVSCAGRTLTNHNKLLWQYPGAVGVKTGYTRAAGRILVSAARRGGRLLVAVTICDPDDWRDHQNLLDYGFSFYESADVISRGQTLALVHVLSGAPKELPLAAEKSVSCALAKEEKATFGLTVPGLLMAPVEAGTSVGTLRVFVGDTLMGETALVAGESVRPQMAESP